jgi:hypothetical protein
VIAADIIVVLVIAERKTLILPHANRLALVAADHRTHAAQELDCARVRCVRVRASRVNTLLHTRTRSDGQHDNEDQRDETRQRDTTHGSPCLRCSTQSLQRQRVHSYALLVDSSS